MEIGGFDDRRSRGPWSVEDQSVLNADFRRLRRQKTTERSCGRIRYFKEEIPLGDYDGNVPQIAVTGLGREKPTLFITNHPDARPRKIIMNYVRRIGTEDGLGTNVNFFHVEYLSSEARLKVDLVVTLTVIANACYRWLAGKLKDFEKAKPKQLSRKFIETSRTVEVLPGRRLLVTFDRRSHNPMLREAQLDKKQPKIP